MGWSGCVGWVGRWGTWGCGHTTLYPIMGMKSHVELGLLANPFNPSTQEAEAGWFLSSRPAWSPKWVTGQLGIYKETLSLKTNQPNKQTHKQKHMWSKCWSALWWCCSWWWSGGGGDMFVCRECVFVCVFMYSTKCCDSIRINFKRPVSSYLWIPGIKLRSSSVRATAFLDGPLHCFYYLRCVAPFQRSPVRDWGML